MNTVVPNPKHFYVITQIIFSNYTAIFDVEHCGKSYVFNILFCFL